MKDSTEVKFSSCKEKPVHEDIEKYNYHLMYSKSENNWYAEYETDCKGSAWYRWNGSRFDLITRLRIPKDLESK